MPGPHPQILAQIEITAIARNNKHNNASGSMQMRLFLASVYRIVVVGLVDWSNILVNVRVEAEPVEGSKATACAKMVQRMQVYFIRCIMCTDKVRSLPTISLVDISAILKYTSLGMADYGYAMEQVAREFAYVQPMDLDVGR